MSDSAKPSEALQTTSESSDVSAEAERRARRNEELRAIFDRMKGIGWEGDLEAMRLDDRPTDEFPMDVECLPKARG